VTARVQLTGLWVYPVKSCRGIPLAEARATPHGLAHDREWLVVDEAGQFVTQRNFPRLAQIETVLTSESLELRAPGLELLEVPLAAGSQPHRTVTVWNHTTEALDEGDRAAAWLSEFLEARLRLVRWDPTRRRPTDPRWTGDTPAESYFADAYPFLVLSEESVADLNARIVGPVPLPMNRFRPNLVIAGGDAYVEDRVTTLRNDAFEFRIVKPCTRCVITTTDQATLQRGAEPLRTLATYRSDPRFSAPVFAQNAILIRGSAGMLRTGMRFEAA
jgi:uncharacterized protein YcbX